ncbi:MAG: site-specific integrase [Acidobacteria bacterium]|nr:site-specific integrase [Acidobacteriota bacterium]
MPRKLRDTTLDTRTARGRLEARRKPYWRRISKRCHLGYRRNRTGGGTWIGRLYDGERYRESKLGLADDETSANGITVLEFSQAQEAVREWFLREDLKARGLEEPEPYTVDRCLDDYLEWYAANNRAFSRAKAVIEAHVRPAFGELLVGDLTQKQIEAWHLELAETPPRIRTARGLGIQHGKIRGKEGQRRRKVSANRALTLFRAALNRAYRDSDTTVTSDAAWKPITGFKNVETARVRYLETDEVTRLFNACEPDFRELIEAALYTGARYGEVTRLTVGDYRPEARAIQLHETKAGGSRNVFLNEEGDALFNRVTAGRKSAELIFRRSDGGPWLKNHQTRRIRAACDIAGIDPPVGFHQLRHTYSSLYLQSGGSLIGLSKQLGHTDTRMVDKHYGHLAENWRAAEAQRFAPSFGLSSSQKVSRLASKRASRKRAADQIA